MKNKEAEEAFKAVESFSEEDIVLMPGRFEDGFHVYYDHPEMGRIHTGYVKVARREYEPGDAHWLGNKEKTVSLSIEEFEPTSKFRFLGIFKKKGLEGKGYGKAVFGKLMKSIESGEFEHLKGATAVEIKVKPSNTAMQTIINNQRFKKKEPKSMEHYRVI